MPSPNPDPAPREPRRFFSPPSVDLSGAALPASPGRNVALMIIDEIARHRDTISYGELKRRAEFLRGEPLAREAPGLWTYEHLVRIDPQPIDTPLGRIYEGYRFTVNRVKDEPHIITSTGFERDCIQFEGTPILNSWALRYQFGSGLISDLPIRLEPRAEIAFSRSLLNHASVQLHDAAEHRPAHLFGVSQVRIGTTRSLELPWVERLRRPFAITMEDRREVEPEERGRVGFLPGVTEERFGERFEASFSRIRGGGFDRTLLIRNDGNVAFHIRLWRRLVTDQW